MTKINENARQVAHEKLREWGHYGIPENAVLEMLEAYEAAKASANGQGGELAPCDALCGYCKAVHRWDENSCRPQTASNPQTAAPTAPAPEVASQEMDTLEWLKKNHPEVFTEQKHLDSGTPERAYWHYGRWSALKDVRQHESHQSRELEQCRQREAEMRSILRRCVDIIGFHNGGDAEKLEAIKRTMRQVEYVKGQPFRPDATRSAVQNPATLREKGEAI